MIAPIGSFVTKMDTALAGSIDGLIAAMTSAMATPIALAVVIYYAVQGLRLANGNPEPLQNFVPQLVRVGTVIWLSTNLSAFNQWVRDIFFTGLPNALANVVGSTTGAPVGVNGTAAVFDALWHQVWIVVGTSWDLASGLSVTGIVAGFSGVLTGVCCGLGLVIMAVVYVCARMVLAVVICISPALIGCALFDVTRPVFERAVGKVISLILLQTLGLVILEILLTGDQWFMAQATTEILSAVGGSGMFWSAMAALVALIVWFGAGAFAMWTLPNVAYSIGSGIMLSGNGLAWAMLARNASLPSAPSLPALPSPNPKPSYAGVTMNHAALAGRAALPPPPPPPSLSSSTRRS